MSNENPIFDKIKAHNEAPIHDEVMAGIVKPEPVLGPITDEQPVVKTPWQERIAFLKNKTFRKWAYGVTAAAISVVFTVIGRPEFIPMVAPLVLAIFYVDPHGKPNEDA